jgi:uncharacterized protein YdeI (YjbR/CyaY-like superfamily)
MKPTHFGTAAEFRAWLEKNHARASELWVAFYKKTARKPGITYPEAVHEALCFGWIDGIIKRLDEERYMHRFSPRKPGSTWSNLNVSNVARLSAAGRMHAAGLAAFAARTKKRTGTYSFEATKPAKLPKDFERLFRTNRKAWAFFTAQPPGYQRTAIHRVVSPIQEMTRRRWLERLISESAAGRRLDALSTRSRDTRE